LQTLKFWECQALDAESYANGAGLLFPLGGGETRLPRTLRPGFGPTAYCTRAVHAFLVVRHLCRSLAGSITTASTAATSSTSSSTGELLIAVEPAIARIAAGAQPLPDSAAAALLAAAAAASSSASGSFADSRSSAAAADAAAGVHWAVAGELLPLAGRRRLCCRLQAQLGGSTTVSSAAAESALSGSAHSNSCSSGHGGHGGSSHGSSSHSSSFNMCLVLDDPMQLLLVAYEGPAIVQQPTANGTSSSNSSSSHGSNSSRRSPSPAPQHELGRIVGAIPYAHAAAVSHGLDRRAVELWAERSSAVNSGLTTAATVQQQEQLVPASALQARPSQSGAAVVAAAAAAVMNASAAALASAAAAVTGLPMANSSSGTSSSASSDPAQPHIVLIMETSADRAAVCAHVDSCRRALSCARLAALQDLLRQVIDALAVEGFGGGSPSSTAPGSPEPACE
jgi:hypothetical protein